MSVYFENICTHDKGDFFVVLEKLSPVGSRNSEVAWYTCTHKKSDQSVCDVTFRLLADGQSVPGKVNLGARWSRCAETTQSLLRPFGEGPGRGA